MAEALVGEQRGGGYPCLCVVAGRALLSVYSLGQARFRERAFAPAAGLPRGRQWRGLHCLHLLAGRELTELSRYAAWYLSGELLALLACFRS